MDNKKINALSTNATALIERMKTVLSYAESSRNRLRSVFYNVVDYPDAAALALSDLEKASTALMMVRNYMEEQIESLKA